MDAINKHFQITILLLDFTFFCSKADAINCFCAFICDISMFSVLVINIYMDLTARDLMPSTMITHKSILFDENPN